MSRVLGEELRRLRINKGVSLREVEKATKVSNAYLSQLENGKTDQPSPRVLHKLAEYYGVPYNRLMEIAGYLQPSENAQHNKVGGLQAALMSSDLTEEEEKTVAQFIQFLRAQRAGEGS
ncbi:MAG TPA: helix-turn-helix transcriptional regulator [Pyrinomonadaceae bacterium]|jgi:transcriptional regulator with XRE-family HTH domain